jgi:hypothetical protein
MKKICLIICIALCLSKGFAQVAINSTNAAPHASAMLDITSENKGLLIPRFTTSARTGISSPAKGLIVYDSTLNAFFYHTGSAWTQLSSGSGSWNINGNDIYNNNSGNVGIGNPSPAKPLDVGGAGGIQISNGANASSNNELFFTDNGQIRSLDNFHRIVFNRSSDQLEFHELGRILFKTGNPMTEAMRVASDGKVGIGTNNPAARLHVVDAINSPALLVESGSSSPVITLNNSGGGSASIDSKVNNVWKSSINSTPQGDLVLTNNGGSMRLQANGTVGIGTPTPDASAILDLEGTKGFLPPKMTQVQRNLIASPAEGLTIYNTTSKKPNYYDGTGWKNFDGTSAN